MKFALSTIAVGVALAGVCHVASAQTIPTSVTVTQQGNGNTLQAEQVGFGAPDTAGPQGTIVQIGDNNHVGGPGATTGGLFQRAPARGSVAAIQQNGSGNNAGITQDGTIRAAGPLEARITQLGNANTATIRQEIVTSSTAVVEQSGAGNLARVEQINSTDTSIQTRQIGNDNRISVRQDRAVYGGPNITQNGNGNAVSTVSDNVLGSGPWISQIGDMNTANTTQTNTEANLSITQQGFGNRADVTQADGIGDSTTINQSGNNNRASVSQLGPDGVSYNVASITQVGNTNTAHVRQVGQGYVANVNQVGSNNYTNIYQH